VEAKLHAFLTSVLDGGEYTGSRTGCFTPGEKNPDTRWICGWGGWECPRFGLDTFLIIMVISIKALK
jgi:hypothetical protein